MVPIVPARGACPSYRPGHSVHPTQARHLWRETAPHGRRPVDHVAVEDSGLLTIALSDSSITHRWNHDPASVRELLADHGRRPRMVLAEPTLLVLGGVATCVCTLEKIEPCPVDGR